MLPRWPPSVAFRPSAHPPLCPSAPTPSAPTPSARTRGARASSSAASSACCAAPVGVPKLDRQTQVIVPHREHELGRGVPAGRARDYPHAHGPDDGWRGGEWPRMGENGREWPRREPQARERGSPRDQHQGCAAVVRRTGAAYQLRRLRFHTVQHHQRIPA